MIASEGDPRSYSAPYDGAGASDNGTDSCSHRGTLRGVTRGLAVYNHVRRLRLPPSATLRDSGLERARHSSRREALRGGYGVLCTFRMDNGSECTNQILTEYWDGPVETALAKPLKARLAAD